MATLRLILIASALVPASAWGQDRPAKTEAPRLEKVAEVRHGPCREISGIVRSRTYPDVYWVHNDSGDEPRLFAIDEKGNQVRPPWLAKRFSIGPTANGGKELWPGLRLRPAANVDWEDIALADRVLYVAEVGNNSNARRDLGIYVIPEPNPRAVGSARPLKFLPLVYPDQRRYPPAKRWDYDCEALFVSDGKLYFLTKHRIGGPVPTGTAGTRLYRLDTRHTDRPNVLTLVERRDDLIMPTAADLSPDGRLLAVLTARSLWIFERPEQGDRWLSGKADRFPLPVEQTKQAEAICWEDTGTLRVANEQRELFRIPLAAVRAGKKRRLY